jgi:MtN3 and saliva related transmembrane protein
MRTFMAVVATSWGLLMGLAPLLQVRVVIQRRSSAGVSTAWIVVLLVGFILWLCYGAVIDAWPLIITNSVACTVSAVTLVVIMIYRPRTEITAIVPEPSGAPNCGT